MKVFKVTPHEKVSMKRLVTHEDARIFHMHKFFGVLCLAHFVYRLKIWYDTGFLGLDSSYQTLWLIMMHAMLHVTSFSFHVQNRRNQVYNIIWPEMRWHSLIFAYRSLLVLIALWMYECGLLGYFLLKCVRVCIVFGTMISADYVTRTMGQGNTMRSNPYPSNVPMWCRVLHNYFYSISQVYATLNMLYRDNNLVFLSLIAIQTAPFLMTLQKKGIITQAGWHFWYTLAIVINYYYALTHEENDNINFKKMAFVFALGRFVFGINKYVLWIMNCVPLFKTV